jgi:uncharacterized protein (DUF488 family)
MEKLANGPQARKNTLARCNKALASRQQGVNGMTQHTLFTTGYSGRDLNSFLEVLRQHDISVVLDVRRNPVSRKRGFSRTALCEFLRNNGVEYRHLRDLGVPQPLRHQLREGECELGDYLVEFREYLQGQSVALDEVYALATEKSCCLVCVEGNSEECHRSVVAEEVAARNGHTVKIVHI